MTRTNEVLKNGADVATIIVVFHLICHKMGHILFTTKKERNTASYRMVHHENKIYSIFRKRWEKKLLQVDENR